MAVWDSGRKMLGSDFFFFFFFFFSISVVQKRGGSGPLGPPSGSAPEYKSYNETSIWRGDGDAKNINFSPVFHLRTHDNPAFFIMLVNKTDKYIPMTDANRDPEIMTQEVLRHVEASLHSSPFCHRRRQEHQRCTAHV